MRRAPGRRTGAGAAARLRWTPAAAAGALAAAGAAVVLAGVGSDWWSSTRGISPVDAVSVAATLSSGSVAFGDTVEGQLDVAVDRRRADPAATRVEASFAPYTAEEIAVERRSAGHAVVLRRRWRLTCLVEACLPGAGARTFTFPAAKVVVGEQTVTAAWPRLEVARRTTAADEARSTPPWRLDTGLPAPTDETDATTLAWLLGGGAAVLVLAAGALLALALRPGPRERRRLSGVPRAVAQLREALAGEDTGARRRALESLAAELRHAMPAADTAVADTAVADTAADAERLAWSEAPPSPAAGAALLARLEPPATESGA